MSDAEEDNDDTNRGNEEEANKDNTKEEVQLPHRISLRMRRSRSEK